MHIQRSACALHILSCIFLATFTAQYAACQSNLTVDRLFHRWSQRQEHFRTVRISWTETVTRPKGTLPSSPIAPMTKETRSQLTPLEDTTYGRKRTLSIDGVMIRTTIDGPEWVDRLAQFVPRECVSVYDGKESKTFHSTSSSHSCNDVYPLGFVDGRKEHPEVRVNAILPLLLTYRPLDPTMTRFKKEHCVVPRGTGEIAGRPCAILEQSIGSSKLQCWVDVSCDCTVRRFLMLFDGNPAFQSDISYERDLSHGWIPSGWHSVVLKQRGGVNESLMATVTEHAINLPIARSQFQLDFPAG
jgi:hypothetical protein